MGGFRQGEREGDGCISSNPCLGAVLGLHIPSEIASASSFRAWGSTRVTGVSRRVGLYSLGWVGVTFTDGTYNVVSRNMTRCTEVTAKLCMSSGFLVSTGTSVDHW